MTDHIYALMRAGNFDLRTAQTVLAKLEQEGFTVYKKKVFKNGRRPNTSQPLTDELKKEIRAYFAADPDVTQQELANRFGVNIGRVSEALEVASHD